MSIMISRKEVLYALCNYPSIDAGINDTWYYYLHVSANGKIVSNVGEADQSFTCLIPYAYECLEMDDLYNREQEDNPDFMAIVDDLTSQANAWFSNQGEE